MIAWGIDIGLTGALARIDHCGAVVVLDVPVVADGAKGSRIDGRTLGRLIRQNTPPDEPITVVMEDVRPRPNPLRGTSIVTEGSLMRSRGAIEAVLDLLGLRAHVVQPQTWKRHYGLLKAEKDESRKRALMLYPNAACDLARKKDHNRAEALLLAHYGMTVVAGVPVRAATVVQRELQEASA